MPKNKYKQFVDKLKKVDFFTFKNVEAKMGKNYAKLFISQQMKKGNLIRICKGIYSFKKSPYILVKVLGKAYLGLGTAALIHNVWDKAVNITILTPLAGRKIRSGERIVGNRKVIIEKISEKMYFGYEYKRVDENIVKVSDPEKTLIDMIYFNYPYLDEIFDNLSEICEKRKLRKYVKIMRKRKIKGWRKVRAILTNSNLI